MEMLDFLAPTDAAWWAAIAASVDTSLVDGYLTAVCLATEMSMVVLSPDGSSPPNPWAASFCPLGCGDANGCAACRQVRLKLRQPVSPSVGIQRVDCGAAIRAFAMPVAIGPQHLATLATEPFFDQPATEDNFRLAVALLGREPDATEMERCRRVYFGIPVVAEAKVEMLLDGLAFCVRLSAAGALHSSAKSETPPPAHAASSETLVARVKVLIEEKLADVTPPELARLLRVSHAHLCRVFKRVTKSTLTDYLAHARVAKAAAILVANPARDITDIAADVGFQSLSPFYAAFKRWMNVSPSQYRKANVSGAVR